MVVRDVALLRNLLAREFVKLSSVASFISCSFSFCFHLGFSLAAYLCLCAFSVFSCLIFTLWFQQTVPL